jgi:hypothetical protein
MEMGSLPAIDPGAFNRRVVPVAVRIRGVGLVGPPGLPSFTVRPVRTGLRIIVVRIRRLMKGSRSCGAIVVHERKHLYNLGMCDEQ